MRRGVGWISVSLAVAALALCSRAANAADYVLGPEDVVAVSVWLHPELERSVGLNADGNLTFPPIGEIKAAGLTPKELGERLADRLSSYLRQTTTVTVTVTQYLSRSVVVAGAVARPGRYGFQNLPGLVDALSASGGALPNADLSSIQIVRREGDSRRTLHADVAAALRDGDTSKLPEIKPGDAINVPMLQGGNTAAPGEGAGVLGEVSRPGIYPMGGGQDLWVVLALAGGLTPRGDLHNVRVISPDASGGQAVSTINLRDALQHGRKSPFVVKPGDVVYVSPTGTSNAARAWGAFTQVLAVSRDALNLIIIRDAVNKK